MIIRNSDPLYDKIEELEKKRIAYLEVDDKAGARRIQKQIERIELQRELQDLNKIKKELNVYKEIVRKYPGVLCEVRSKLIEQGLVK